MLFIEINASPSFRRIKIRRALLVGLQYLITQCTWFLILGHTALCWKLNPRTNDNTFNIDISAFPFKRNYPT